MTIFQSAEKLKFQENLPFKEAIMFLEGTKYQTGSDYSEEILNSPVEELNKTEDCKACEGRGWNIFNTSPEGDKDICPDCWGSKVLYPLDIFNSIGEL